ncbi:ArdC-like ssDNA-binding domain-containing protein [Gryllotalpicola protaetiae]|uniref:Serine/arginine repetitive matrix protein 2 n=1 Tax=Gryllotalpicola protaetiae TaxID=2419771 RepID=A0A387BQ24_9MICO|nr:ArdC-like ssDNA-binding domain-containing protein [Gryllotalpicola protaetiae]AYG04602.1 serine/arginine repetitive matrix protein 2 [Gryllotalpicola protaetiae]
MKVGIAPSTRQIRYVEKLHEHLVDAVERVVSGNDWRRALEFTARFRSRSFGNTLLIWAQHLEAFEQGHVHAPEPTYVAGYKQWQSLSRQVKKGQPGYMILAPVTGRFASSTPQDPSSWRRLGRVEKPKAGEAMRSRMVGAKPAYVWDVSQTDGDPIPERPSPLLLEGEAPEGLWDGLAGLVEAEGFAVVRVEHEEMIHGANGLTDYQARTVAVRTNMDDAAQVKTLAHELAHVKLHGPDSPDATGHRGVGEVEAESVALMIGAAHGMDTTGYTIPYVSGWASTVTDKDPAEVVQATGERVRKAAGAILDALPTAQIGDGDPPGLTRDPKRPERTPRAERPAATRAVEPPRSSRAAEAAVRGL